MNIHYYSQRNHTILKVPFNPHLFTVYLSSPINSLLDLVQFKRSTFNITLYDSFIHLPVSSCCFLCDVTLYFIGFLNVLITQLYLCVYAVICMLWIKTKSFSNSMPLVQCRHMHTHTHQSNKNSFLCKEIKLCKQIF